MIIDCVSDLHGFYPVLEGGDLLIVAGDLTATDTPAEYVKFYSWLHKQPYRHYIFIAGNHDGLIEAGEALTDCLANTTYLCDSGTEFEGLKIWGSPYTPTFSNWHFMEERGEAIKKHWDLIPDDIDILITHGPPQGILDEVFSYCDFENVGCDDLLEAVGRVKPKLHVFGHIHEGYGMYRPNLGFVDCPGYPIFVNASHVNEHYEPVNKPIRVIL